MSTVNGRKQIESQVKSGRRPVWVGEYCKKREHLWARSIHGKNYSFQIIVKSAFYIKAEEEAREDGMRLPR